MARSTVTSKGQTTIPKEIRDHLKLRPGYRIDFVIEPDGRVVLRPAQYDIRDLHGLLHKAGREKLTAEEMNQVTRERHKGRR